MSIQAPELYIGLMSGTSMDGIDAALVEFNDDSPRLIETFSLPWPEDVQNSLIAAREIPDDDLDQLTALDRQTAQLFADACLKLLDKTEFGPSDIRAVGSHGQTIRHRPDIARPFSLQIGDAEKIAALTGIDVIADFRTADIEAGGQGAPLAPAFHQAVFRSESIDRVIVNIGGIANITVLPKNTELAVSGFDCGPGNTLMDAWIARHQQLPYDAQGKLAAQGRSNAGLLARLLMDPYFQLPPPKSTGFEYFNLGWLYAQLDEELSVADVERTLCQLTATSIIRSINKYASETEEIFVCGGGAHNKTLMHDLQALTKCTVDTSDSLGVHPDWVEAMAFAWLAYRNVHQLTGNLPSVTGASEAVVLGKLTRQPV